MRTAANPKGGRSVSGGLQRTVEQLLAATTEDEVYQAALAALVRHLDADRRLILRFDGGRFETVASAGLASTPGQSTRGQRLIEQSYRSGKAFVTDDVTHVRSATNAAAAPSEPPYRSLLCIPIEGFGVLAGMDRNRGSFDDDLDVLEPLGAYVASALEHVRSIPNETATSDEREDADHDLDAIASMLSHDVRNSLFVAREFLDLARTLGEDEQFEQVEAAHDRIENLVEGVVLCLRTGNPVGETDAVELASVVEEAWNTLDTENARLEIDDSVTIEADESRLCQMLDNLLRNAVEHNGGPITVRVGSLDDSGFFVADDGNGIDADDRERVFDERYSSTEDHAGLGLSIVRRIVDGHGWEIDVTESDHGGARFEITGVDLADRMSIPD